MSSTRAKRSVASKGPKHPDESRVREALAYLKKFKWFKGVHWNGARFEVTVQGPLDPKNTPVSVLGYGLMYSVK